VPGLANGSSWRTWFLVSLPIAGCALAASVVGALTDRKRPFSLLRLTAPRPAYYGITLAGLAVSLAIIAATFPLLTRITGPRSRETSDLPVHLRSLCMERNRPAETMRPVSGDGDRLHVYGGTLTASIPAPDSTASNASVNCPARSQIRNRNWLARSRRGPSAVPLSEKTPSTAHAQAAIASPLPDATLSARVSLRRLANPVSGGVMDVLHVDIAVTAGGGQQGYSHERDERHGGPVPPMPSMEGAGARHLAGDGHAAS
jgi:hypothetical protein